MRRRIEQIFDVSRYSSPLDRDRARMIYGMSSLMIVLLLIVMTVPLSADVGNLWQALATSLDLIVVILLFIVPTLASIVLTRGGRLRQASFALVLAWILGLGIGIAQNGFYSASDALVVCLIILLPGLLLDVRGLVAGTAIGIGIAALSISARASVPPPASYDNGVELFFIVIAMTFISGFTFFFLRYAHLSRTEGVTLANEERLRLAEITTQVSQRISQRMGLSDVLNNAVEQIHHSYPTVYHSQIFLTDENQQNAELVASTGEVGRMLLGRKHGLGVGSLSVIGQVTFQGVPIIARAGNQDSVHRRNEFLPDTVVEAAFPLRIGDTIIGALDMQSKQADAFSDEVAPVFQSLADHLAIAIDNARLFEQTEQRLQENQLLVEQTRRAAEEVERLNQQLTRRFWDEYLHTQGDSLGLNVDFASRTVRSDEQWTPFLQEAVTFNHLIQEKQDGSQVIAVPLRVRGQVIGAMEFELDEDGNLTPEDLNLIEEVGEQLGLAAETNRLFETSQRVAQREALVNEIATRLQGSNNVEMTLSEAARSLRSTLKANRVSIRLGTPPVANGNHHEEDGE